MASWTQEVAALVQAAMDGGIGVIDTAVVDCQQPTLVRALAKSVMAQVDFHARSVMTHGTKEMRAMALGRVPGKLRPHVDRYVRAAWARRVR